MIALIISLVLQVLCLGSAADVQPVIIPAKPDYAPIIHIDADYAELEWAGFYEDAVSEYMSIFSAIYGEVEVKRSKNNRIMVKGAYSNTFKFAPKGK